jgi:hypothetical protein
MENIHVIKTDKPSRLVQRRITKEIKTSLLDNPQLWNNINIYITSDEEIKERDWCLDENENIVKADKDFIFNCSHEFDEYWKKIILTTDLDLIKDGVQAIDDTFLEWFVKNPSCEFVEVKKFFGFAEDYLIILPKEEPKQKYALVDTYPDLDKLLKDKKQETLEEAAENFMSKNTEEFDFRRNSKFWNFGMKLIKFGAQWQAKQLFKDDAIQTLEKGLALLLKKQERMYSEEEVYELLKTYRNSIVEVNPIDIIYLDKWFEQFKKK